MFKHQIVIEMCKCLLFAVCILMVSCTDQGDPIQYAVENTTSYRLEVIRFDRFGMKDTTMIDTDDFQILSRDVPPYDDGPFGGYDSLRIQFEDGRILTYQPPALSTGCLDSIKSPFCHYTSYLCLNSICTFEIDSTEYMKAK